MEIALPRGKYVAAVSGGVDSVVLLHLLIKAAQKGGVSPRDNIIVAHFDHGIRDDSADDANFVALLASENDLVFEMDRTELGQGTSESQARKVRYEFLEKVRKKYECRGIITAHHEDDLIETMIINMIRGTSSRGLHSLSSTEAFYRPLLGFSKKEIVDYAVTNNLSWHEDSTNSDDKILRNYIRHKYVSGLNKTQRQQFVNISSNAAAIDGQIDEIIAGYFGAQSPLFIDRKAFKLLPTDAAREIMAAWLRLETEGFQLTHKMLSRLVRAAQTGTTGKKYDIMYGYWLYISKTKLQIISPKPISGMPQSVVY